LKESIEKRQKNLGNRSWKKKRRNLAKKEKEFSQELPREFTAKLLYGWGKRRYEREREKR